MNKLEIEFPDEVALNNFKEWLAYRGLECYDSRMGEAGVMPLNFYFSESIIGVRTRDPMDYPNSVYEAK